MAFRYTLRSVLRLRQALERQEEQKLLVSAALVAQLRLAIAESEEGLLEARKRAMREMEAGGSGASLKFFEVCHAAAKEIHQLLEMKFAKAESEHLERVLSYRDARQKREIFEGLRDTQQTLYERTEAHREQERVDEAFLIRSSGKSVE